MYNVSNSAIPMTVFKNSIYSQDAISSRQNLCSPTDTQHVWRQEFRCCRSARAWNNLLSHCDRTSAMDNYWRQWKHFCSGLTHHSASRLCAYLHLRNILTDVLTYLLTYMVYRWAPLLTILTEIIVDFLKSSRPTYLKNKPRKILIKLSTK